MNPIDISVLKRSLSSAETSAEMLTRMMETGVRPYIGSNIDVRV
ncbi:MAG: putative motility protein [Lachnospiraceae bacterium]|nr:putative motility protein [Lachnospiraceae bacterium]